MISFISRTCLYVFILMQACTSFLSAILTTVALVILEALAYFKGQDDAMNQMIKIKGDNSDGN